MMYLLAAIAFIFYVSKVPERYFPGKMRDFNVLFYCSACFLIGIRFIATKDRDEENHP